MQNNNLEFCQYYSEEKKCPFKNGSFEARAWMAENEACLANVNDAKSFLSYVVAYMSKWDPYEYRSVVARYVANSQIVPWQTKWTLPEPMN